MSPTPPELHAVGPRRPRVLLTTEGTYPYVMGGVSSWCELLVGRLDALDWHVLPIVAPDVGAPLFTPPPHVRLLPAIEVWSTVPAAPSGPAATWRGRRERRAMTQLPATLARELLGWDGDVERLVEAWVRCRSHPGAVRGAFRSRTAWKAFLGALEEVGATSPPEAGAPPALDLVEAAELYQTLYWVARTAAVPTPPVDVLHVTAAGWSAIPALVHKALHGTPLVLTEHGVFVREAYLAAAREGRPAGARFAATRLARGLARAAYAGADVVSPVTDANAYWELGLGVDPTKILPLYNGLRQPAPPTLPPRTKTVVSVGRIDALKDFHTMLRTADRVLRAQPAATFLHYGPVATGAEAYARSCRALHARLGLGDRFRFMGPTTDPHGVMRAADVVLLTSISEGLPMVVLEAMGQGRPVVATGVGGVPEVVHGCGVVCPPADDRALATALITLLRSPSMAWRLGRRGHERLGRMFDESACIEGYRELLGTLAGARRATVRGAEAAA